MRRFFLVAAFFLFASGAQAAVASSAIGTAECHNSSSVTITCATLTAPGGSNPAISAYATFSDATSSPTTIAATWNGVSMSQVAYSYNATRQFGIAIFCLPAPASGAQNLVVTGPTGVTELHVIAAAWTGANQTTPCNNATTATNQASPGSVTITSATGNIATALFSQDASSGIVLNGTSIVNSDSGPNIGIYSNYATGAATVNLTATAGGAVFESAGVNIAAAGGGGATSSGELMLMGAGD